MVVLGIDMGDHCGLCVITDERPGAPGVVGSARPLVLAWQHGYKFGRYELQQIVERLCREHRITLLATEQTFFAPNDRRRRAAAHQREQWGLIRAVAEHLGIHHESYAASSVKVDVASKGRAAKTAVAAAVHNLVRGLDSHDQHVCDACAIALTGLNRYGKKLKLGKLGVRI